MPVRDVSFAVNFRENLRWMCRLSNLYYSVLSGLLGFNKDYISRLVNGYSNPSMVTVIKVANYFDVPLSYMLSKHDWSVYKQWPK
jgi:transcriptional regulator with XRE-family HTH domain